MLKVGYSEEVPDQTAESQFDYCEPVCRTEELDYLIRHQMLLGVPEGLYPDACGESIEHLSSDRKRNHWRSQHRLPPQALD